jgi:hypothetical protein
MAKLTNETSKTCPPTTCGDLPNAIGSLVSVDGPTPCALPDGTTLDLFGPVAALVNPSQPPARKKAGPTIDISGRIGRGSSASVALSRSLGSRLRARLPTGGSTLFSMTWSERVTPAGRHVSRLQASGLRTSDNGSGSWPSPMAGTPSTPEYNAAGSTDFERKVDVLMGTRETINGPKRSWPTPVANDDNKTPEAHLAMKQRMGERDGTGANRTAITSLAVMAQTSWRTPHAEDYSGGSSDAFKRAAAGHQVNLPTPGQTGGNTLGGVAKLTTWATPSSTDMKGAPSKPYNERGGEKKGQRLDSQVVHLGPISSGSPAETGKAGQLNPAFSRWLMGYPPAWDDCAVTATQSFPKRQRRSSKPISPCERTKP